MNLSLGIVQGRKRTIGMTGKHKTELAGRVVVFFLTEIVRNNIDPFIRTVEIGLGGAP